MTAPPPWTPAELAALDRSHRQSRQRGRVLVALSGATLLLLALAYALHCPPWLHVVAGDHDDGRDAALRVGTGRVAALDADAAATGSTVVCRLSADLTVLAR